jgi:hypothetical protein
VTLTSLCVNRTNPVCPALGALSYEGGVDENGDGQLQAGEADTVGAVASDGNVACAHNIGLDFDPQQDRGKKAIVRVRVTDQNGEAVIDRKTSQRI